MRNKVKWKTKIRHTHLRYETPVVSRDYFELYPTFHLPIEFTHFRDIPQTNVIDRCPK